MQPAGSWLTVSRLPLRVRYVRAGIDSSREHVAPNRAWTRAWASESWRVRCGRTKAPVEVRGNLKALSPQKPAAVTTKRESRNEDAMYEGLEKRRGTEEIGMRKTGRQEMRKLVGEDLAAGQRADTHQPGDENLRGSRKRKMGMRRVRRGDAVFHDLWCGHRKRLCSADTASEAGSRPIPGRFRFECKKTGQQTKAEGNRSPPEG